MIRIVWKKYSLILAAILLAAILLRLINLEFADVTTDEALYSFRSIGYLDYTVSQLQTTPVDWFGLDRLPAWTKLSFHDHPPLVFLLQYIFFKLLGVSLFTARLPFALAGLGAVLVAYLIGKQIQDRNAGLIAALLLTVANLLVWVSRIGLLEAVLIFFTLLSFYAFLIALKNQKFFLWWGVVSGLALLTKYTAVFPLLGILFFVLIWKREFLRSGKFWSGVGLLLITMTPVIIYNLFLYSSVGHFDLQLSALFNQPTPEWAGIARGSPSLQNLGLAIKNLANSASLIFVLSAFVALLYVTYFSIRDKLKKNFLLLLALVFIFAGFIFTGAELRFVPTLIPFLSLVLSLCLSQLLSQRRKLSIRYFMAALLVLIVTYEFMISFNKHVLRVPFSPKLFSSAVSSGSAGFNELNNFLNEKITEFGLTNNLTEPEARSVLFIYDSDINYFSRVWYIERRVTYEAVPFTSTDEVLTYSPNFNFDYYEEQNYSAFIYIDALTDLLLVPPEHRSHSDAALTSWLMAQNIKPQIIPANYGPAFNIYSFVLNN